MKRLKQALSLGLAGVMMTAAPMTALASPEFSRSAEEWAKLRDNTIEYDELEGLIQEYNATVQTNNLGLAEFKRKYGDTKDDVSSKYRDMADEIYSSINYPDLGILRDGVLLRYIRQDCTTVPTFSDTLDNKVALLKLTPGQDRSAADFFLERNDALIIESFGVGGLPEHGGFYDCLQSWIEQGKFVVLTTQVPSEGSDVGVYHVGHSLKANLRVLEAYDMTTEAVVAKLMWILGRTHDRTEVEKLFYTPIAKDILFPVHGWGL